MWLTGTPEMVVILPGIKTYPGLGPARRPGQPRHDVAMLPVPSSPARMLSVAESANADKTGA
jgi:hypothetical protein